MLKTCTKCGQTKPLDEYRKDSKMRDGYGKCCKECKHKLDKEYRNRPDIKQRHSEYRSATKSNYGDRYKGRYNWSDYSDTVKAWHDRHPLAYAAHKCVQRAIEEGALPKASECRCTHCGKEAFDYHHHDGYDVGHELDVIPLCRACHRIAHSQMV